MEYRVVTFYSALMPANLITLAHFSVLAKRKRSPHSLNGDFDPQQSSRLRAWRIGGYGTCRVS
jgi:hypothetical protein